MTMPTIAEERALALHRPVAWRRATILTQFVLFILTAIAIAALAWLLAGWIAAIVSIVIAELLMARLRFWRTGVESALWIGGLFAFIVSLPSSGKPEAILAFVAASAIAGWRMRNGLFGTLAAVLVAVYMIVKEWPWLAAGFALAVCIAALVAEIRLWQRPSTEFLWEALLIVMPVVAYVPIRGDVHGEIGVAALFASVAVIFLVVGIHFRLRIVLLAFAVTTAIATIEIRDWIPLSDEAVLIVGGAIVLGVAGIVMRMLRGRERGFVLAGEPHELDEAVQIAATLPLAAPTATPARPAPAPGGGEFGGAGASGQF